MPISTKCPHCGLELKLKNPDLAGKKVQCPTCQEAFRVAPLDTPPAAKPGAPSKKPSVKKTPSKAPTTKAAKGGGGGGGGADDDWMTAIDSLARADEATGSGPSKSPPVVGKKMKKSSSAGKKRQQSRWRDVDGDLYLWVQYVWMITLGSLFGFLGMGIWAGLTHMTHGIPLHWVAVFVGVFIGTGVRLGASKWDFGWGPALTATVITFFAIVVGKVVAINALYDEVEKEKAESIAVTREHFAPFARHENYEISKVAGEISVEWMEAGREIHQPEMASSDDLLDEDPDAKFDLKDQYDPEKLPQQYPAELWAAASERWQALPEEEKERRRAATEEQVKLNELGMDRVGSGPRGRQVFGIFDVICLVLGLVAAFRIAAGFASEEEQGLR